MTEPALTPSSFQLMRIPRPNPWQELAYLTMFVMELSWIIPWYILFAPPSGTSGVLRSILAFGGTLIVTHVILRVLDILEIKRKLRRWSFVLLLGLSLVYGFKLLVYFNKGMSLPLILNSFFEDLNGPELRLPVEFVVAILIIVTAYRGAVLAGEEAVPSLVGRNMRLGLVMLGLAGLFAAITFKNLPGSFAYLLVFLFASLLSMTSARIYIIAQLRGGQGLPFEGQRVTGLIMAVLGLVILAGLAGLFFSSTWGSGLILGLFGLAGLLLRWLATLAVLLLYPLIFILFSVVQWIASHLTGHLLNISQNQQANDVLNKLKDMAAQRPVFYIDERVLRLILYGGLFVLATVAVVLLIRSRSRRGNQASIGVSEALLSSDDMLRQILASVRKNAQAMLEYFARGLGLRGDARRLAAQRIRQIYTDLLDLAAKLKYPRYPQQTPLEYLPELNKAFPDSQAELALITQAYQRIRYGELPEMQAEVNAIESAWKHVQVEGKASLVHGITRDG
jgi:hypothetical protein